MTRSREWYVGQKSWHQNTVFGLGLYKIIQVFKFVFYIYYSVHHNILWNNQQMQLYAVNFIPLLSIPGTD